MLKPIRPMKALDIKDKKATILKSYNYLFEEKIKGMRGILYINPNGIGATFITSGMRDRSHMLPHICNQVFPTNFIGCALDGELKIPGYEDEIVSGLVNANEIAPLLLSSHFHVFDLPYFQGESLIENVDLLNRKEKLSFLFKRESLLNISLLSYYFTRHSDASLYYCHIVDKGGEGIMFKNTESLYILGPTKRVNNWYKWKDKDTYDVVICGFIEGKGKYSDTIGAFIYGQYGPDGILKVLGSCAGFSDALRYAMGVDEKSFLYRVCELEASSRSHTGALVEPRFKQFRSDKQPRECTYD